MKTAREIVQEKQQVIPDDKGKSFYIVDRGLPLDGDMAAEISLSSHSGKWLCHVYSEKRGRLHDLSQSGMNSKSYAKAYLHNLKGYVADVLRPAQESEVRIKNLLAM